MLVDLQCPSCNRVVERVVLTKTEEPYCGYRKKWEGRDVKQLKDYCNVQMDITHKYRASRANAVGDTGKTASTD